MNFRFTIIGLYNVVLRRYLKRFIFCPNLLVRNHPSFFVWSIHTECVLLIFVFYLKLFSLSKLSCSCCYWLLQLVFLFLLFCIPLVPEPLKICNTLIKRVLFLPFRDTDYPCLLLDVWPCTSLSFSLSFLLIGSSFPLVILGMLQCILREGCLSSYLFDEIRCLVWFPEDFWFFWCSSIFFIFFLSILSVWWCPILSTSNFLYL